MKLSKIHIDVWMGGLLIILSAIFYMMAEQFSNPEAATWPKLILLCIIILSVMLVLHGIKLTQQNAEPGTIPVNVLKGPGSYHSDGCSLCHCYEFLWLFCFYRDFPSAVYVYFGSA